MAQDLTPVELQLCYDEYREDPEVDPCSGALSVYRFISKVRSAWSKAGVENSIMMPGTPASPERFRIPVLLRLLCRASCVTSLLKNEASTPLPEARLASIAGGWV